MRLALLGDFTVDDFRACFNEATLFVRSYSQVEDVILHSNSELYQFNADVVVVMFSTQALRSRYHQRSGSSADFIEDVVRYHRRLREQLEEHSQSHVFFSNFVEVSDRLFGNHDHLMDSSFLQVTNALNQTLKSNLDINSLAAFYGHEHWFDARFWYLRKSFCHPRFIPKVADRIMALCRSSLRNQVKCVVLDLDGTLWGGILGDDGYDIILGPEGEGEIFRDFQAYLLELKRRGVLLAVASKNDLSNVLDVFRHHPDMVLRESDISVFKVNWENKADSITQIAVQLNIALDSVMFIDDSPLERNLVRSLLSEVIVPELSGDPALYIAELTSTDHFGASLLTSTDERRSELQQLESERRKLRSSFMRLEDFLLDLRMQATITPFQDSDLERIVQLTQRTNQFNLRTQRYNLTQTKKMMQQVDKYLPLSVTLKDRLGHHGLVSVIIFSLNENAAFIDQWLLSCRVFSRGLENFIMNAAIKMLVEKKITKVVGEYLPTEKNKNVASLYEIYGFKSVGERWEIEVSDYQDKPHFIKQEQYDRD
jgi:FkbH-like protein